MQHTMEALKVCAKVLSNFVSAFDTMVKLKSVCTQPSRRLSKVILQSCPLQESVLFSVEI